MNKYLKRGFLTLFVIAGMMMAMIPSSIFAAGSNEEKTYVKTDTLKMGQAYLIVSVDNGNGVALAKTGNKDAKNGFKTLNVTVSGGTITVTDAEMDAVWKADEAARSNWIGLYNGENVLRVNAQNKTNPFIHTGDTSYNAGNIQYTSAGHLDYPYGITPTHYYIGYDSSSKNFVVNSAETGLGKVYLFAYDENAVHQHVFDYEHATYTWSEDHSTCEAKAVCSCGETVEETKASTIEITKEATCEDTGIKVYTAQFNLVQFGSQSYKEDIPKLGHQYSDWTVYNETQHKRVCSHDATHVEFADHTFVEDVCSECGYRKSQPISTNQITGKITSYGDKEEEVTLQLLKDGEVIQTVKALDDGSYCFDSVANGDYTIVVNKKNHVSRSYDITVAGESTAQDMTVCLLGDANNNGRIESGDYNAIYNYIMNDVSFKSPYAEKCANANGNSRIESGDYNAIYNYIMNDVIFWK